MRLQLISDLHTEFHEWPLRICEKIEVAPDLDFLVIAGDLVVPARQDVTVVEGVFHFFSQKARHILYVEGNHEFYGGLGESTRKRLQSAMPRNYTWLRNEKVVLDGIKFFGGALWFDNADGLDVLYRDELNDWSQITDLKFWVYKENAAFLRNAHDMVDEETIVISHHLPHRNSVPPEYKTSSSNRWFVSYHAPEIIQYNQPRLWLHGHTHQPCDYKLGETHVVCNPYGYPQERRDMGPYPLVLLEV